MKAIEIKKMTVKCDICNWAEETNDVLLWHNKLCPLCGKCIIVNDYNAKFYNAIMFIVNIVNKIVKIPEGFKGRRKDIHIDSAALRNNGDNQEN